MNSTPGSRISARSSTVLTAISALRTRFDAREEMSLYAAIGSIVDYVEVISVTAETGYAT